MKNEQFQNNIIILFEFRIKNYVLTIVDVVPTAPYKTTITITYL